MLNKLKYFLPSFSQCWVAVFYILVIGGIGIGLSMMVIGQMLHVDIINFNLLLTYLLPMLPVFFYFAFKGKESFTLKTHRAVPLNQPHFGKMNVIVCGFIVLVAVLSLGVLTDPLSNIFPMSDALKRIYSQMEQRTVWSFISIAICAPIVEETILRGMMERGMLYHNSPKFAILWSAFFFAFIHLNLAQAIPAFTLGILFGWIYYKTHCLWATIFMHAMNNASTFLIFAAYPSLNPDSSSKEILMSIFHISASTYYIAFAVLAVVFCLCIWLLYKYLPKYNSFKPQADTAV
ncbi:MAG: CPBP family intramembrane metalloprotease [Bacteroidales bacterium]|jgi:membrane protease YdiL (CAAX protease family)|nr:CPBP family intramembrane metalloprotease [Bacteroidales bacterium]MCI1733981.1 CPBP family intramembrane metalloprotease [Bacteroidales bacterium]